MLELKGVGKSYTSHNETVQIFHELDWEVNTGSFVAVMGPSGSGKSTLLSLISGIIQPDRGMISLGGTFITALTIDEIIRFRGQNIAFIFQAFELIPNLTVEENIDLVIDISHTRRRFTTSELLEKVGLKGKGKRYPTELSGGEQQRVAIARAFVSDVPYLFADEPTGNLDEGNAERIMELIDLFHRETGNTIVMITHDNEVAKHADLTYRLHKGTLTPVSS